MTYPRKADDVTCRAPNYSNYPQERKHISKAQVLDLQATLMKLPQVDMPVKHHFADHVYAREVFHAAGVAVVGYEHRTDHLFILASGELSVSTDNGMRRLIGPCVLRTKPGSKKAAYAHTDCTVITIHVTDETDPEKIMDDELVPEPGSPLESPGTDYLKELRS